MGLRPPMCSQSFLADKPQRESIENFGAFGSREIPPEAVRSEVVFSTVFPYNFRPEVDNDVISGYSTSSGS